MAKKYHIVDIRLEVKALDYKTCIQKVDKLVDNKKDIKVIHKNIISSGKK